MKIVFLGSAGVGKGTYAKLVSKEYKIPTISSGQLFRSAIESKTQLGLKAKTYMDRGVLVPDALTNQFIINRINQKDCVHGFILDGFPRNMTQAKWLDKLAKIDLAFNFIAPQTELVRRMSGRYHCTDCSATYNINTIAKTAKKGICDKCGGKLAQRDDDTPAAIKKRLEVYRKDVAPVIAYYDKRKILYDIGASYNLDDVHKIIDPVMNIIDDFDTE
jgi:adenylate kinase